MTSEQLSIFLRSLEKIANKQYTITGASDWPLLVVLGGLIVGFIALMWRDLKSTIKGDRDEAKNALKEFKAEHKTDVDNIWSAMKACQDDCCPRRHTDQ